MASGGRGGTRLRGLIVFSAACAALALAPSALAAAFTVTSTADSGAGSLRDAITQANGLSGTDTIQFDLPFGGSTISPASNLPDITDPVTIDGTIPGRRRVSTTCTWTGT